MWHQGISLNTMTQILQTHYTDVIVVTVTSRPQAKSILGFLRHFVGKAFTHSKLGYAVESHGQSLNMPVLGIQVISTQCHKWQ